MAPQEIADLAERFKSINESCKSGRYNEAQVIREFVDPFLKALGWDIDDEQSFAEACKGVIYGANVDGTTKVPDFSFRIEGQRKFFLETWKPSDAIIPSARDKRYPPRRHGLDCEAYALAARASLEGLHTHAQTALQRQIESNDHRIDALVNEPYGLTEEEIGIMEARMKP